MKVEIEADFNELMKRLAAYQSGGNVHERIEGVITRLGEQLAQATNPQISASGQLEADIQYRVTEIRAITAIDEDQAYWLRLLIIEATQQKAQTSTMSHRECMEWYCGQLRAALLRGEGDIVQLINRYKASLPISGRRLKDGSDSKCGD